MLSYLIIVAISFSFVIYSHGQGTLNFSNFAAGVDAPIRDVSKGNALACGVTYTALLFVAPAGVTDATQFTLIGTGTPLSSGFGAGYFLGGDTVVNGFGTGSTINVLVRAFNNTTGTTYANSIARGQSNIIPVTLGGGQVPSPNLVGFLGFSVGALDPVPGPITPEPSTIAIGILGVIVLLLRPRTVS